MYKVNSNCIACWVCQSITRSCQIDTTTSKAFCVDNEDQEGLKQAKDNCPVWAIEEVLD